jgi:redox-sensitive bicupin YhaK (pirin superfamily)
MPRPAVIQLTAPGLRVIAGSAYGATSPVRMLSSLFYVEAQLESGADLPLPEEYAGRAVYVVDEMISCDGQRHASGTMSVFRQDANACVTALTPSRVMLLGGAPLDGERYIWWNFVSSSKERIERAKDDWRNRRFPAVRGDVSQFIPLPD